MPFIPASFQVIQKVSIPVPVHHIGYQLINESEAGHIVQDLNAFEIKGESNAAACETTKNTIQLVR